MRGRVRIRYGRRGHVWHEYGMCGMRGASPWWQWGPAESDALAAMPVAHALTAMPVAHALTAMPGTWWWRRTMMIKCCRDIAVASV